MDFKTALLKKIRSKKAVIGIVGLGYVGLPLLLRFAEEGFETIGLDIDQELVDDFNNGISNIHHISSNRILKAKKISSTIATTEPSAMNQCDVIILCVPTPLTKNREPNLKYVKESIDKISKYLKEGQLLSLESTTYPGTTEEVIVPRLESLNFQVGKNYFVAYSPEREDPGNKDYTNQTIPKICGGHTSSCLEVSLAIYSEAIQEVIPLSSTKAAEMTKLLENIHRSVNIGLVNEMKVVADKMGIDIFEVIDAAATKPFGFTAYYPGPGLGGHCIPIDPFYLTWKAREFGINTKFIEIAGEINKSMHQYVCNKTMIALNERSIALKKSKILILGLSYKKNVDDVRESPSILIMEELQNNGAIVNYSDPYLKTFPKMREFNFDLSSIELTKQNLEMYDAVLLLTDHDDFDYEMIKENSKLIIDTRGKYREFSENILRA